MHAVSIIVLATTLAADTGFPRAGSIGSLRGRTNDVRVATGTNAAPYAANSSMVARNEIVDEWATRPRIDVIPFADRERTTHVDAAHERLDGRGALTYEEPRLGLGTKPKARHTSPTENQWGSLVPRSSNTNNRNSVASRDRNLTPLDDERIRYQRSSRSSIEPDDERYDDIVTHADSRQDRNRSRKEPNDNWNSRSSPPKAAITETKGTTTRATSDQSRSNTTPSSGSVTVVSLFLFMSLGGNLYLGWLARDFYWRYRDLAWEVRNHQTGAGSDPAG